jgi:polyketide biosynthesis acyl carrier protein
MKTKSEIFGLIQKNVVTVLPFIEPDMITPESSLRGFGANSIDRMEILLETMEALDTMIPMTEFGSVSNIQGIIDLLHDKINA